MMKLPLQATNHTQTETIPKVHVSPILALVISGKNAPFSKVTSHPTRIAYLWPVAIQQWMGPKLDSKGPPSWAAVVAPMTWPLQIQDAEGFGKKWQDPKAIGKGPTAKICWMPLWHTRLKSMVNKRDKQQDHQSHEVPQPVDFHQPSGQNSSQLCHPIKRTAGTQMTQGCHNLCGPLLTSAPSPFPWDFVIGRNSAGKRPHSKNVQPVIVSKSNSTMQTMVGLLTIVKPTVNTSATMASKPISRMALPLKLGNNWQA